MSHNVHDEAPNLEIEFVDNIDEIETQNNDDTLEVANAQPYNNAETAATNEVLTRPLLKRRRVAVRRLDNTIKATSRLANLSARKVTIKEDYYAKKLKLMEQTVDATKRYAAAAEKQVSALYQLTSTLDIMCQNIQNS